MVQTTEVNRVPEAVQTKGEVAVRAYRLAFALFADPSLAEAVAFDVAKKYTRIYGPMRPPSTPRLLESIDTLARDAATAVVHAAALQEARRAGAGDDAQDVAVSTLLTVMRSYRKDHAKTNLAAFIARTTRNAMVDAWRHRGVHSRGVPTLTMLMPASPDPIQAAVSRELASVLAEALNVLSEAERTIILGQIVNDESLSDIAHANGMSLGEAQRCLRSGLTKLRSVLTSLDFKPELTLEERIQRVEAALDNLDPKERDVLLHWIMDDLTETELCQKTGATKRHLKKAQDNFRKQLDKSRWGSEPAGHLDAIRRLAEELPEAADVFLAVEFEGKTTDDLVPSRGTRHQVTSLRKRARASIEARRKQ
jgi:RNA polymerase sigma factor (sigma-70 family)